mgnify:CR=1 FL=1
MKENWKTWFKAAGIRAIKTIAQTAVDENQKPREDITINSVSIETYQG